MREHSANLSDESGGCDVVVLDRATVTAIAFMGPLPLAVFILSQVNPDVGWIADSLRTSKRLVRLHLGRIKRLE